MPRFLISRLSALGDVVCSLPAAAALKEGFPDCHTTWVVSRKFADIVRSCSAVDEVVAIDKARWNMQVEGEYEAALDLQGLLKSALVLKNTRAKAKLGYHRQREGAALFSARVLPDASSIHVVDQYVDVARAAGGVADRARFAFAPTAEALSSVRAKGVPQRFVVLNPGAAWVSKRWPSANAAEFIDALQRNGTSVVLIGGKGEAAAADAKALCKTEPVDLGGQTSIAELVALISLARAHIGGDTGSSHIAAALGVPAIGLYSATRPERSCPYGQIERCIFNSEGLSGITASDVLSMVEKAIS